MGSLPCWRCIPSEWLYELPLQQSPWQAHWDMCGVTAAANNFCSDDVEQVFHYSWFLSATQVATIPSSTIVFRYLSIVLYMNDTLLWGVFNMLPRRLDQIRPRRKHIGRPYRPPAAAGCPWGSHAKLPRTLFRWTTATVLLYACSFSSFSWLLCIYQCVTAKGETVVRAGMR